MRRRFDRRETAMKKLVKQAPTTFQPPTTTTTVPRLQWKPPRHSVTMIRHFLA